MYTLYIIIIVVDKQIMAKTNWVRQGVIQYKLSPKMVWLTKNQGSYAIAFTTVILTIGMDSTGLNCVG